MTDEQYEKDCEKWRAIHSSQRAFIESFITSCIIESQGESWSWDAISRYIDAYFAPPSKAELEYLDYVSEVQ